ncbi:uroporphyrinogen decarboxylase family protein [Prevotella sp. 10(H)]|uniref:uroporphyrinogen decarboxylase family protein n=1 Tax=Prevotella sp. 10(H) TaxID=1158294 RepID=UPI0004A7082F|nr:uroporphyrinogen decarboxylase family protein [Prevotella sp. 10(H)]
MTSRERVLKAFKIIPGLPDRVPIEFDLSKNHLKYFGEKLGIPVNITDNPYEDVTWRISGNEIRVAMGSDVVITGASVSDNFKIVKDADETWLNEYGMRMRQGQVYVEVVGYPLAHAETKADIDAFEFPDPYAPGRYRDAERLIAQYKKDYLIFGDVEVTIFSLAQQLVGLEKLLIDMMLEAEYVQPLFAKCTEYQTKIAAELIKRGVDAIWYGDDFGTQNSLLMPPDIFVTQVKPWYKKMNDDLKKLNPDIILILHSDGAVAPLLKDIKEMGFEIFNPVQPDVPGHSAKEIKEGFDHLFAFWGAIDQQHLLPFGTDEELEADIKEKIEILGAGGGYMIAPAHIMQDDVSHERVEKFISLCRKYGAIY